jgi:hypothetical protein
MMTLADLSKVIGVQCPGDAQLVVTLDNFPVHIIDVQVITTPSVVKLKIKTVVKEESSNNG